MLIDARPNMRSNVAVILLMLLMAQQLLLLQNGVASPTWADFTQESHCATAGFRKHSAILRGATGDLEAVCKSTAAVVENVYFARPDECVISGGNMRGDFNVRDTTCHPSWGSFKNNGCQGHGLRRYSSVLWHIQGSWQDWCSVTPATVRGVFFPVPSLCESNFFNEWGNFDMIDPCCPGRDHTDLRSSTPVGASSTDAMDLRSSTPIGATDQALFTDQSWLLQIGSNQSNQLLRNGGSCEDDEDRPPFPNQGRITSMLAAIQLLMSGNPPFLIADFIFDRFFRVVVGRGVTTPEILDCYFCEFINEIRFQSTPYGDSYAFLRALHIPTTPGALLVDHGGSFPANTFASIDAANPVATLLTTEQLSGCCLVFGWDNDQGRLHIGHAQPNATIPEISFRTHMANYMRRNAGFAGIPSSTIRITFMGGDDNDWYSYYGDRANVVGFVYEEVIYILVQVVDANRETRKAWTFQFYRQ